MKTNFIELKHKLNEVYVVEPNDLGNPMVTQWYRRVNRYFKKMPFIVVIPLSFFFAGLLYLLFGYLVVRLTTTLQYGF